MSSPDPLPTVTVDGARFEYDEVPGDQAAAPLLFLHEGLGSVGLWRGFHRRVAAATGRRTVAYSRLGYGFSDPPAAKRDIRFMHAEAEHTVPAVLDALGMSAPVLVGHSDGASIALLVAAGPVPVNGLVVLAPHVFVEDAGLASIAAIDRAFRDGELRARMARHHADPDIMFRNWADVWLDPAFRDWDITAELADVRCPVLAVQGDADEYGSMAHVEAVRDRARGPVELLTVHSGHSPHLELPEQVADAVSRFVRTLP